MTTFQRDPLAADAVACRTTRCARSWWHDADHYMVRPRPREIRNQLAFYAMNASPVSRNCPWCTTCGAPASADDTSRAPAGARRWCAPGAGGRTAGRHRVRAHARVYAARDGGLFMPACALYASRSCFLDAGTSDPAGARRTLVREPAPSMRSPTPWDAATRRVDGRPPRATRVREGRPAARAASGRAPARRRGARRPHRGDFQLEKRPTITALPRTMTVPRSTSSRSPSRQRALPHGVATHGSPNRCSWCQKDPGCHAQPHEQPRMVCASRRVAGVQQEGPSARVWPRGAFHESTRAAPAARLAR